MIKLSKTRAIYIAVLLLACVFLFWDRFKRSADHVASPLAHRSRPAATTLPSTATNRQAAPEPTGVPSNTSADVSQWLMTCLTQHRAPGMTAERTTTSHGQMDAVRDLFSPSEHFHQAQSDPNEQSNKKKQALESLRLSSILIENNSRYVQISSEIYKVHDFIGHCQIREIQPDCIILADDDSVYTVYIDDTALTKR